MPQRASVHVLAVSGPQTVREVVATQDALRAAFRRPGHIALDCSSVGPVDLTFVQLLISAQRSAAAAGRRFTLHARPQGSLLDCLVRGGFISEDRTPPEDPGLWHVGGRMTAA